MLKLEKTDYKKINVQEIYTINACHVMGARKYKKGSELHCAAVKKYVKVIDQ